MKMNVNSKKNEEAKATKPPEQWTIKDILSLPVSQLYKLSGIVFSVLLLVFGLGLKLNDWMPSPSVLEIKLERENFADNGFLYSEFFKSGGTIILSNPPVYKYLNKEEQNALVTHFHKQSISDIPQQSLMDLHLLDIGHEINVGDTTFRHVIESLDEYTGIGEALGLLSIKEFFIKHRINSIKVAQSNSGYPDENLILLGGWISHCYSQKFIDKIAAYMLCWNIPYRSYDGAIYKNGVKKYEPKWGAGRTPFDIKEDYAIITRTPSPFDLSKVVIICAGVNSQGTEAASRIISEDTQIERLKTKIKEQLGTIPTWFQVIIQVPVVDGRPSRDWKFITCTTVSRLPLLPN